jgi:hypothetical protein
MARPSAPARATPAAAAAAAARLVALLAAALAGRAEARLRVAFLSDLHVGEACEPVPYNGTDDCACITNDRRAIAYVNALAPRPDAVIVTGDITSSSWPTQWTKARALLDALEMPFFPLMGNHDVWPYDREGGNETKGPYGDQAFGATFGDIFRNSQSVSHYAPLVVPNPLWNSTSCFQNLVITLVEPATGARLAFVAGDWSTREPAPPPNSGVPGWAERGLSDFPGGTLPWLKAALAAEAARPAGERPGRLFLVQHQPVRCPIWIPDALFCFGAPDKALLAAALTESWPRAAWWGAVAGHNHVFINDTVPFESWPDFREVEVSAAKGDGLDSDVASSIITFDFDGAEVAQITKHYYSISEKAWTTEVGQ